MSRLCSASTLVAAMTIAIIAWTQTATAITSKNTSAKTVNCTAGENISCVLSKVPEDFSGHVCYRIRVKATTLAGTGIYVNNVKTHVMQFNNSNVTNFHDPAPLSIDMNFDWQPHDFFPGKVLIENYTCGKCDKQTPWGSCLTAKTAPCKGNVKIVSQMFIDC